MYIKIEPYKWNWVLLSIYARSAHGGVLQRHEGRRHATLRRCHADVVQKGHDRGKLLAEQQVDEPSFQVHKVSIPKDISKISIECQGHELRARVSSTFIYQAPEIHLYVDFYSGILGFQVLERQVDLCIGIQGSREIIKFTFTLFCFRNWGGRLRGANQVYSYRRDGGVDFFEIEKKHREEL